MYVSRVSHNEYVRGQYYHNGRIWSEKSFPPNYLEWELPVINTEAVELLVKLCVVSSYIKGEHPVSAVVMAPVEHGKSTIVAKFSKLDSVLYMNDVTAWGLQHRHMDSFIEGKIKTLAIPDLILPLSKNTDTADALIGFLMGLTEEGIARIDTYATHIDHELPTRINLITAIAKEFTGDRRYRWTRMGFLTRVIPISYQFSGATVDAIHDYIRQGAFMDEQPVTLPMLDGLPPEGVSIHLPDELGTLIQAKAQSMGTILQASQQAYGFRLHRQLHALVKASALYMGRDEVDETDVRIVRQLCNFINFNYTHV